MDELDKYFEKLIWQVVDEFLIPKFNELKMNASGEWLGSLDVQKTGRRQMTIKGVDYTKYLVNGRANGKQPPVAVIQQWAMRKFGIDENKAKSAAFAIAKKIGEKGTRFYPDGTDLLEVLKSEQCTNFINDKLKEILVPEIRLGILRRVKQATK